ncbi:MAG: zinc metalloprotease HtpX [Gammaproteobacteria bacterium]|nr:zinc metalloprotease HtpX [Gammaproteobacteria bacterium]
MSSIEQFSTANWRETLKKNNRKTIIVISLFVLIYLAIGLLVDVSMGMAHYPNALPSQILQALLTLQMMPIATLVMCAVAGISLLVTFSFHDQLMLLGTEYHEITPETARDAVEQQLYNVVEEMKIAAGLRYMPRVYLIEADYMNAFASGYSEKSAMVAITRRLAEKLNRSELQAVMAHELSHIRHMDIKLTLMASVLANLIVMVIDMLFYSMLYSDRRRDENDRGNAGLFMIVMLLRYLLPVINILLLMYLSRTREFMADAGCVELTRDNQPLASALLKIQNDHLENRDAQGAEYQRTPHENVRREAYIFDPIQAGIERTSSFSDLFSTHPDINDRLAALGFRQSTK